MSRILTAFAREESREAVVVRLCDHVAYLNHDLDDAIRAGIVAESELPEIINMCDNVCVIKAGRMTGMLGREELDQERIMQYAAGGEE